MLGAKVTCTGYHSDFEDVSDETKRVHAKYGLKSIVYRRVDACCIPFSNQFDIIALKSVIGGITRNSRPDLAETVISQIYKALRRDGRLVVMENLCATFVHRFFRNHFGSGADDWHYFRIEEIEHLLQQFRSVQCETFGFFGCFGRNESQRTALGILDSFIEKIIPDQLNYIIAAVATK
jgi:SAM-dependent methyltransferase